MDKLKKFDNFLSRKINDAENKEDTSFLEGDFMGDVEGMTTPRRGLYEKVQAELYILVPEVKDYKLT